MMFKDLSLPLQRGFEYAKFRQPGLVYFLRHLHCPFGRRTLRLIAQHQTEIRSLGLSLMFIHMGSDADFREAADSIGLANYKSISDPDQEYYLAFGLHRADLEQGRSWPGMIRYLRISYRSQKSQSLNGDLRQTDGMFIVSKDQIHEIHRTNSLFEVPNIAEKMKQAQKFI